ncbi:DUF397 domain-containing protein [Actinomadura rugatobispora]|uniref:DUF397 domain-containing protein n=1 Tax=Actinomadura rugatobispora TaxID=1994 RepID=A0ABW1A640_9ACTN|nr:hypothetical protein GCM10010200_055440 [Actinomadura rugatobispora]
MASAENQPISWRKSSRCAANGTCVEIAAMASVPAIAARDAKHGDASPVLLFSSREWRAFTDRIKRGEFEQSL